MPLALAFAIASGVPPEKGLITAVGRGLSHFVSRAAAGCRSAGPPEPSSSSSTGIVQKHGFDGLVVCTLIAGVLLIAMGLARFGGAIKFIPYPVVTGFTSGIALIIFSSEVKDLLGLRMGAVPAPFLAKWAAFAEAIGTVSPAGRRALGRVARGSCVALAASLAEDPGPDRRDPRGERGGGSSASAGRDDRVAVRGAFRRDSRRRDGPCSAAGALRELFPAAVTVALLAAIESLLSAVVADGMIGSRHKSNVELVAQGVANIGSSLFGGIPATGAIARTATNVKNGGRTPVAGMIHAVTVLRVLLLLGRWVSLVPLATLAAILTVVAYHMSEWRSFVMLLRSPKSDVSVLAGHVPPDGSRRPDRGGPGRHRSGGVPLHPPHGRGDQRRTP